MSNFLHNKHPEYKQRHDKWQYSWDQYTGEAFSHEDFRLQTLETGKGRRSEHPYLHRKVQAETDEAYIERILTSEPVLLYPTAVDSLNGIGFSKDSETERSWGAFGDVEEVGSIAYNLWQNADGLGTNWSPFMKKVGIKQTVLHRVWGLVEGMVEGKSDPCVKLINPQSVVNWYPDGNPTEVLVKEKRDLRGSIKDENGADTDTYILYTLEGWQRYVDGETGAELIEEGEYQYFTDATRDTPCLPIFYVDIPMPRDLGYLLAMKNNHIFNAKSIRDFSVRNMSFAFLQVVADEAQFQVIMENIKKGFRVLRRDPEAKGDHGYKSPPSDYLSEAGNILDKNKEDFMESAFRSYGDAARQVTATEIRQESRSGVEAFLNLLISSVDEFENKSLFLLEQAYFKDTPSNWGQAYVKRSTNFQPQDIKEAIDNMAVRVFGEREKLPLPMNGKAEVVKRWSDHYGIPLIQANGEPMTDEQIVESIQIEMNSDIPDPFTSPG